MPKRVPDAEVERMADALRNGASLRQIAAARGVKHQAVSQLLRSRGYNPDLLYMEKRREANQAALFTKFARLAASAVPCAVCGYWAIRPTKNTAHRTCSPQCAGAWDSVQERTPEGRAKRRMWNAQWAISHPEHPLVDEVRLRHSRKVLAGKTLEARGTWHILGSRASQIVAEAAPDLASPLPKNHRRMRPPSPLLSPARPDPLEP